MNLRERLRLRATINLIISVLERLVNMIVTLNKSSSTKKESPKKDRSRPVKNVLDKVLPWRNKK